MWKWLKETILVVAIVVLTTAGAAAAAPSLSDGAHLLTPAEQAEVSAALQAVEQRYDVRIAVVTVASTPNTCERRAGVSRSAGAPWPTTLPSLTAMMW